MQYGFCPYCCIPNRYVPYFLVAVTSNLQVSPSILNNVFNFIHTWNNVDTFSLKGGRKHIDDTQQGALTSLNWSSSPELSSASWHCQLWVFKNRRIDLIEANIWPLQSWAHSITKGLLVSQFLLFTSFDGSVTKIMQLGTLVYLASILVFQLTQNHLWHRPLYHIL